MISKNLIYLRKKNKLSQQALADLMGVARSTLGDYERGMSEPNITMLIRFAKHFGVTMDQLLVENISHQDLEIIKNKDMRVLAITVDSNNRDNIEMVDSKAEAGYLSSYSDPEFIKELPKISFPNMPQGTFRGFEIQGDSMLPVEPGSVIICSYVERLEHLKDDKTYVIISRQNGLVYKRVKNDPDNLSLTLISDNEAYLPYRIDYTEIDEVWQYFAHLSFSDTKMSFNSMLEDKLSDIQLKLNQLVVKE